MLGSFNTNLDYVLNQPDNQLLTLNTAKNLSKYFGSVDVSEKYKKKSVLDEESTDTDNVVSFNKKLNDTSAEKTNDESKPKVINIFDEEEGYDDDYGFTYDGKVSIATNSFETLAAAIGATGDKITKGQLIAYLQTLVAEENAKGISGADEKAKEITFVKNLIAKFDTLSNGEDYITSLEGANELQDYTTITTEQVTPPVDIRV
ncbi:MAG: hypothetical protein PHC64_08330 [Candidatus Gastranaerophilales bacterium]|nr:hypothetical protein [Candidatus Gastranaerophilales bacterium]